MRLEVLVPNEEPQIYPLNKAKVLIGSHESCDIIISGHGISRKHLMVITEEDEFFVTDQGSTNGSYINEERLVPGRRAQFTSFFPIRLSDGVLLTLLSDDDITEGVRREYSRPEKVSAPQTEKREDSTQMINLRELSQARTENLVKKRQEVMTRKRTPIGKKKKSDEESRMLLVKVLVVLLLGGAFYYNVVLQEEPLPPEPVAQVGEVIPAPAQPEKEAPTIPLVSKDRLVSYERLLTMVHGMKCTSDVETFFCDLSPQTLKERGAVIQSGMMVILIADATEYRNKIFEVLKLQNVPPDQLTPAQLKNLKFLSHLYFLERELPEELNAEKFKDFDVTIALIQSDQEVWTASAFTMDSLIRTRKLLKGQNFSDLESEGPERMNFLKDFFVVY